MLNVRINFETNTGASGTWKKPSFTITEESMSLNILVTFILQKTKKQKSPKETKIQKR